MYCFSFNMPVDDLVEHHYNSFKIDFPSKIKEDGNLHSKQTTANITKLNYKHRNNNKKNTTDKGRIELFDRVLNS